MLGIDLTPRLSPEAVALVEQIEALEADKARLAAAQARLTAELDELAGPDGVEARCSDRSLAATVGMARHESPHRGRALLGLARALVEDLPELLAMLEAGEINERRVEIIATETRDLSMADRATVGRTMVDLLGKNPTWGDRQIAHETRRVAMRVDPEGTADRREKAQARRGVNQRVDNDGTGTVVGRVADWHVALIMDSLRARAAYLRATGDERTTSQIMADLYVQRLTGQPTATCVPLALQLVVSAETLLADGNEPAEIPGYGPIPAEVARKLATAAPDVGSTIRRLFADTDHLVAMESTTRCFEGLLRSFVTLRDRRCRMPWCNNPIDDADHVQAVAEEGETTSHNGQGLCRSCNLLKEEPGWHQDVVSRDIAEPHEVETTTPAGHRHRTREPSPPGNPRDRFVTLRPGLLSLIS